VLALDYMKRTKKLTPEVHAKAEGFIANAETPRLRRPHPLVVDIVVSARE
jgi:hypothetical protein